MNLYNIDDIRVIVESKYSLCIALAKRAREIGIYISAKRNMERVNVIPPLVENESEDAIEVAIQELREEKVSFKTTQENT